MKKQFVELAAVDLIGLAVRTNNENELNPETAKIGPLAYRYFSERIMEKIPNQRNPGVTIAVYTDYASDHFGDYTYFIGAEVSSLEKVPDDLTTRTIVAGKYQQLTTEPGPMPAVVIEAWQSIWQMTEADFGGERAYSSDFEVYDQRAADPKNTVLDIYIGIK